MNEEKNVAEETAQTVIVDEVEKETTVPDELIADEAKEISNTSTSVEEADVDEIEEVIKSSNKPFILATIVSFIVVIGLGLLLCYPFVFKLSGKWVSSNVDSLSLQVDGKTASIKSHQAGIDVMYQGKLIADGVNTYYLSDIQIQTEVDKTVFSSEDIEELQKNEKKTYKILEDTEDMLLLEYTKETVEKNLLGYNKDRLVLLKLPMIYSFFSPQELVINSQYLYQELIHMDKETAK